MDDAEELLIKIIAGIILVVPLSIVLLIPTWLVLHGNWAGYAYWIPITITISGYLHKIGCILYFIMGLTRLKASYFFAVVYAGMLGFIGMPVLKQAVLNLVLTFIIDINTNLWV